MVVASSLSIDMVSMLVSEPFLERFPRINFGTPRKYDWRYHFGQCLSVIVSVKGKVENERYARPYLWFQDLCVFNSL